jgi:hypothetical protein
LGMRGEHDDVDYVEITAGASAGARVLAERAGAMRPGTLVTLPTAAAAPATGATAAPAAAPATAPAPAPLAAPAAAPAPAPASAPAPAPPSR